MVIMDTAEQVLSWEQGRKCIYNLICIVRACWLVEKRVCIAVEKHGNFPTDYLSFSQKFFLYLNACRAQVACYKLELANIQLKKIVFQNPKTSNIEHPRYDGCYVISSLWLGCLAQKQIILYLMSVYQKPQKIFSLNERWTGGYTHQPLLVKPYTSTFLMENLFWIRCILPISI